MAMKNVHIEHKMIRIGLVNDLSTLVKGFTMPNSAVTIKTHLYISTIYLSHNIYIK